MQPTTNHEYDSTVVDISIPKKSETTSLEYPCLVLTGIEYSWEVKYFQRRLGEPGLSIPVYVGIEGEYLYLTSMELTSDSLSMFNSISNGSYGLEVHKSISDIKPLDYTDGNVLEKFIRL